MEAALRPGVRVGRGGVGCDRRIGFMGGDGRVDSTPDLVHDIEDTGRDLMLTPAGAGEDCVGMEVAIRHSTPTRLGMPVGITLTVTAVDGRSVSFDVAANDDVGPIAAGTPVRLPVDVKNSRPQLRATAATRRVPVA